MARKKYPKAGWQGTLRAVMDEKGVSVDALSERLGFKTRGAVDHWLNGNRGGPNLRQFLEVCQALGVHPVEILDPGYVPETIRAALAPVVQDVLSAKPADKPGYRKAVGKLKRTLSPSR